MHDRRLIQIGRQDGTAIVEMALVLPLLLFLALGIVDFGKAINYWNDSNQIAADAARYAAVNGNPGAGKTTCGVGADQACTTFADWVRRQADTNELGYGAAGVAKADDDGVKRASTNGALQVCVDFPNAGAKTVGNPIKITIKTDYSLIPFLNSEPVPNGGEHRKAFFGHIVIKGEATMRLEQNSTLTAGCS
jgi:hypothetical protein